MSNAIFPSLLGQTWNITRAPRFATKIQQAVGGRRITAAFQPYPIYRWSLEFEFLRTYTPAGASAFTEWQQLIGFFNSRQGAFDSFLYSDPEDNTVLAASPQLIGTGNASTTTFQLGRALNAGLFEPIYNVDARIAAPKIYLNGVLQGGGYTISATGLVTFGAAPGVGVSVSWSGQFYWRCQFETDDTEFAMIVSGFWKNPKLAFVSLIGA
jgi:uncharacterized protein (TIGR02217 family)